MIRLAVFLGNPGKEYEKNRHDAGRLLVQKLPFFGEMAWTKKFGGLYASLGVRHFLSPQTYMNNSGEAVKAASVFFKIAPEEIIVIHDELELFSGWVSFKFGGGLGGHNGLRSIKQFLGTADFWRLRIGIGRPGSRKPGQGGRPEKSAQAGGSGEIAAWVLSDFGAGEETVIETALEAAALALDCALKEGPENLLPLWAKKNTGA